MISVLVADDHGIVREGLRRMLEAEIDLEVSGEARDGREVLHQVEERKPHVVVLDISMPRLGGLETLERLRTSHPDVKVVLLSVHADAPLIQSPTATIATIPIRPIPCSSTLWTHLPKITHWPGSPAVPEGPAALPPQIWRLQRQI